MPPTELVIHHTAEEDAEQHASVEENHKARGYEESQYGSHIAYHFMVGTDGTLVQNRGLDERTYATQNSIINNGAIHIVVNGNFQETKPSDAQITTLRNLIERLDAIYEFEEIIGHKDASPTACPGKYILEALSDLWRNNHTEWQIWRVTRYYTPEHDQPYYFHGGYDEDFKINCSGDCLVPADGSRYTEADAFKVAACPPEYRFGTKVEIEGIGVVTCKDRGGAIKEKRLDVWAGIGNDALLAMKRYPGHYLRIRFLQ